MGVVGAKGRRATVSAAGATAVVVGNMIGTGVFTSLGFQVSGVPSGFALLLLWVLGGVFAFCGALSYGELAAALPRSGGEYHFLSRIYSPVVGFLSGWIAATVGFAAPVALMAMAFGDYFAGVCGISATGASCAVVLLATGVHLCGVEFGSGFQVWTTALKLALIVGITAAAFALAAPQPLTFAPRAGDGGLILSAPFAISLVYVMYSYEGWNAATYIAGEVRNPQRIIPLALLAGTAMVTVSYVAINAAFLYSTPMEALAGKLDVGLVAGREIFGARGGEIVALAICAGLVSSISAMTWAGPRVGETMGEDYRVLRWLARTTPRGVPWLAILWQTGIVFALLLTATFREIIVYLQLILLMSSFLTVLGVIVLRWRRPDLPRPYRTWGYPATPLVFLAMSGAMMIHIVGERPVEAAWGLATLALGAGLYAVARGKENAECRI
jgi:APA family basic amino acid/polyamine antiporter